MSRKIVIVGGGFAGAATACHLSAEPGVEVVLLERDPSFGQQASGRNAGMIRTLILEPEVQDLALRSAAAIRNPAAAFAAEPLFHRSGGLILASGPGVERLRAAAVRSWAAGHPVEEIHVAPAKLSGWLDGAEFEAGFLVAGDGVADIHALLQGYLRVAAARGADLRTGVDVTRISAANGRVRGVETSAGPIGADVVVNAAGAWAADLGRDGIGPRLGMEPRRRHLHSTGPVPGVDPDLPFVWNDTAGYYFRPESGGFLLCGCDETTLPPGEPSVDPLAEEHLAEKLLKHTPALANLAVRNRWAGLRTFARDGRPVIGWDPTLSGLFWVAALGGHGATLSHGVGELAAREILASMDREARHFAPSRFWR